MVVNVIKSRLYKVVHQKQILKLCTASAKYVFEKCYATWLSFLKFTHILIDYKH